MKARTTSGPEPKTSLAGLLALLLLAIFTTEIAVMELLSPLFSRLDPISASLIDAAVLVFLYAFPLWHFVIQPLFGGKPADEAVPRISPAVLCAKALVIIFVVELLVMAIIPHPLPRAVAYAEELEDAFLIVLLSAPLLWWLLFRPEMRKHQVPLSHVPGTPLRLYVLLLFAIFMGDLLQEFLSPFVFSNGGGFSRRIADSVLTTVLIAPFLWALVARPLRRMAHFERTRASMIHTQVLDAIVTINPEGVVESFNPAAERIFGYPAAEITGETAACLLADNQQSLDELLCNASAMNCQTDSCLYYELPGKCRDGSTLTLEVSISKLSLEGRQEFLMIMRDISGRKKLESALREREELFRSLSECAPVGVFHTDADGNCLYNNQRLQDITGLSLTDSLGTGWTKAIHPEDREAVLRAWNRTVTKRLEFMMEFRFLTPLGEERWVISRAAAILSVEGKVVGYVGTTEDISARKLAEQQLLDSLSLLSTTLESTADGILAVDTSRRVRTFNQKFLDMWRFSRQFVELSDTDQLRAAIENQLEAPEAYSARVEQIYSQPEVTSLEVVRFRDGRVFERYSQPQRLEADVVGRVWSYRDITARAQAEDALRKSEERFNIAISGSNVCIWDWNLQTGVFYHSPRFKELLGYPDEDLPDTFDAFEALLHHEDHDRVMAAIRLHLEQSVPYDTELRLRSNAGEYRWFRTRGHAVLDDSGVAVRMAGSLSDINRRKEAAEALLASEARFRQVFEQTEDAIIFFKPGTCSIIDVNATAEKLYGYSKAELKESGLECLGSTAGFQQVCKVISGIKDGDSVHLDNIVSRRKDGTEIIVSMRGKVMTLQGVAIIYCTFRDATDRVRMEEEARHIQARLIQANKMTSLGLLVSGVAHEINNPNNFIMANSQLLARAWEDALKILRDYHRENGEFFIGGVPFSDLEAHSPQLFADIRDGACRINEIVNNLKSFARQDMVVDSKDVDVNAVVASATSILRHELTIYTEHFHLDLAQNLPSVKGNGQQLGQVIINLLMNACQALPGKDRGVWLTTGFDPETREVIITVRDEGCGIAREAGNSILEPFFTTKLDNGGTGLGLSISRSIINEHKGHLFFESEPGKGSTFTVSIPAG